MPASAKITDLTLKKSSLPEGRHNDSPALYVNVTPSGTQNFLFMRYVVLPGGRKRVTMGIGAYPAVSLAEARQRAAQLFEFTEREDVVRRLVAGEKFSAVVKSMAAEAQAEKVQAEQEARQNTFANFSAWYIDNTIAKKNTNKKAIDQWRNTLRTYCQHLMPLNVEEVTVRDVVKCIQPIWYEKNATAKKLLQRVHKILGAAHALGHRSQPSPAAYQGNLENILPSVGHLKRHHPAMPYKDVPDYYAFIAERSSTASFALRFIILTAARSGEGRGALWSEIDMDTNIWTLPATRMKARTEHAVPLSDEARRILERVKQLSGGDHIFKADGQASHVTESAVRKLMSKTDAAEYTIHGFRSSFRDWAGNETEFPREMAEEALAHQLPTVEKAYRRGRAIEKRRAMMQAWADYLNRT